MNKKTFIVLLTIILSVPAYVSMADETVTSSAETNSTSQSQKTTSQQKHEEIKKNIELKEERQEKKEQRQEKRCEVAQKRIQNRIGQLKNNREMYNTVYGNMKARLDRLVKRLESKNLDTSKLSQDMETLNAKIDQLKSDYQDFIDAMTNSQNTVCNENKEQFKNQLTAAREKVAEIKKERAAIKNFFLTTIKPDLQALREQIQEQVQEKKQKQEKVKTQENDSTSTTESE